MKKKTELVEEVISSEEQPRFKVYEGGKTPRLGLVKKPPEGDGFDWLSGLSVGVFFIAGEKAFEPFLQEYKVLKKKERIDADDGEVIVQVELQSPSKPVTWIDPMFFCNRFRLLAIKGREIDE